MHGMRRHSTRTTGVLALGLLSASVLLALVFGGAVARADSSEIQYTDAPPTLTGDNPSKGSSHKAAPARSSKSDGGDAAPNSGTGDKSSAGDRSSSQGDKPTTDDHGGTAQSSPDDGSNEKSSQAQTEDQAAAPASSSDDDGGGSSPLLPILIAIGVLAAVSVGVVMMRARRQSGEGPGQPAAPKAS